MRNYLKCGVFVLVLVIPLSPAIYDANIILGGHSWGGGMSLAYAAGDKSVQRIFSVAGTDHGTFIRKYLASKDYAEMIDTILASALPGEILVSSAS